MITESSLDILNQLGFGADINKLESYVMDYNLVKNVADISRYEFNYKIIEKILKSIKSTSKAFETTTSEIPFDEYDELFKQKLNLKTEMLYGYTDDNSFREKAKLIFSESELMDLVAISDNEGIDIICIYSYGSLVRIYAVSEKAKCYDFTDKLMNSVPNQVIEFEDAEIVEIRARAIIKDKKEFNNPVCETMHRLRLGINEESIEVICNDIMFNDDTVFYTYWEKLEYLESLQFNVVGYCLLRNIDKDSFKTALEEMSKYLIKEEQNDCRGIIVRNNKEVTEYEFVTRYSEIEVDSDQTFESTVKTVIEKDGDLYLDILETECNKQVSIGLIKLDDVFMLEKNNLSQGSRVRFKVVEGKPLLV